MEYKTRWSAGTCKSQNLIPQPVYCFLYKIWEWASSAWVAILADLIGDTYTCLTHLKLEGIYQKHINFLNIAFWDTLPFEFMTYLAQDNLYCLFFLNNKGNTVNPSLSLCVCFCFVFVAPVSTSSSQFLFENSLILQVGYDEFSFGYRDLEGTKVCADLHLARHWKF